MNRITGPIPDLDVHQPLSRWGALNRLIGRALMDPAFCDGLINGSRARLLEADRFISATERSFLLKIQASTLDEFARIISEKFLPPYGDSGLGEPLLPDESQAGEETRIAMQPPALLQQEFSPASGDSGAITKGDGEVILVVEDDDATRKALQESLLMFNYRVLEASNGREALQIVEHHSELGLVLTDAVMPETGGIELLRALRQRRPAVKVVMLTGYRMNEDLERLQREGLTGWLLKPPSLQGLAKVVAKALGKKG